METFGAAAQLIYLLIGALIGGMGASVILLMGLRFVLASPALIKALEGLANSFPPDTREVMLLIGNLLTELGDDIPAERK